MAAEWRRDEPWRRLPWLLPLAIAITMLSMAGFTRILAPVTSRRPPPLPLDVALVELPPTAALEPSASSQAESARSDRLPEPEIEERIENPSSERREEATPLPVTPRKGRPPKNASARSQPPQNRAALGQAVPSSPTSSPSALSSLGEGRPSSPPPLQTAPPGGDFSAARAIYQPMPVIPEELRRRQLDAVAIVVFNIGSDGSVAVELRAATDDPRLNQALLDGFRRWRFFPALDQGRPTASTLELRVPIQVR